MGIRALEFFVCVRVLSPDARLRLLLRATGIAKTRFSAGRHRPLGVLRMPDVERWGFRGSACIGVCGVAGIGRPGGAG
jgi:hypothetical protein